MVGLVAAGIGAVDLVGGIVAIDDRVEA